MITDEKVKRLHGQKLNQSFHRLHGVGSRILLIAIHIAIILDYYFIVVAVVWYSFFWLFS